MTQSVGDKCLCRCCGSWVEVCVARNMHGISAGVNEVAIVAWCDGQFVSHGNTLLLC